MIDELAAVVVAQLNGQVWTPDFTATFHDSPVFTVDELATLRVTALPFSVQPAPIHKLGQKPTRGMRGVEEYLNVIDIAFQQKGPAAPTSGLDPIIAFSAELRLLIQTVAHWLNQSENRMPAGYQTANRSAWVRTIEMQPLYDANLLRTERLFIGVLRVTYEEFIRE